MKITVIGHPEAVQGFALAGLHGQIAVTMAEVHRALDEALQDAEIGILLITNEAAALAQTRLENLKLRSKIPLIIEIPGPAGVPPNQETLSEIIQRAIGVRF